MRRSQSFVLVTALAASLVMLTASVAPAVGAGPACRGSVARVENLLGLTIEPFVANPGTEPCVTDGSGILPATTIGPLTAEAVFTRTFFDDATKNSRAQAAVLGVAIGSPSPFFISAIAAFSSVSAFCGRPADLNTGSVVVGLNVNGTPILVPPGHTHLTVPGLATLHLNHVEVAGNFATARAIWLDLAPAALPDVIVAESFAGC